VRYCRLSFISGNCAGGNDNVPVNIRSLAAGDATLILTQPAGFSTPATRQRLKWRVAKAPLRLSYSVNSYQTLGIFTQVPVGYYDLPMVARSKNVTVSSSDAGKLVLSADPKVLGSGTLTITAGSTFYLQALANHGIVHEASRHLKAFLAIP